MTTANLQTFHNSLSAAVEEGISLCPTKKKLTQKRLDEIFAAARNQISVDSELGDNDPGTLDNVPDWYVAGLQVFQRTRSVVPVLESWYVTGIARKKSVKATRWTTIYFILLLVAAVGSLFVFYWTSVPEIANLKNDINLQQTSGFAPEDFLSEQLIAIIGLLIAAALAVLIQHLIKGKRFLTSSHCAAVLKVTKAMTRCGAGAEEANQTALTLTSAPPKVREDLMSLALPKNDPGSLASLASYFSLESQRRLVRLQRANRLILIVFCGGGIALAYGVLMFFPITQLLDVLYQESVVGD